MLIIKNLKVAVEDKPILKGVSLDIKPGEIHAIMGPNGSGKSTLAYALAGHPHYDVTDGKVMLNKKDLLEMSPDGRAQAGLFLAFQYPVTIPGLSVQNFLKSAYQHLYGNAFPTKLKASSERFPTLEFRKFLKKEAEKLDLDPDMLKRSLNDGFSGGEKKRIEVLQMAVLKPKFAILDETDSGLDIDSIKITAKALKETVKQNNTGSIVITHYQRILNYLDPTHVHIMISGRIKQSGGPELVEELEKSGYKQLLGDSE